MPGTEQQNIKEIEELVTKGYMAAVHSKDPKRYAALFTEDAMWMPPEAAAVIGRSAIENAERRIFESVSLEVSSSVLEADASGDLGWALGELNGTAIPHSGSDSTKFYLRLMWIVQKENRSWKIHRQIWNARPLNDNKKN